MIIIILFAGFTPAFFFLEAYNKLGSRFTSDLAKTAIQNIDKAVLRIAAEMPIRMSGEFAEKYLQAVVEPAFRNMALNEHNEIRLFSPDNFYQGMIGAFTAGLLEGGPAVAKNISNTQIGHGVNEAHKADELIGRALMLDNRTEAFRLASKLANGSVHKNNYNVGELLQTYVEADGDTAFMSMPNKQGIANTQAVRTTLEQEKAETPEKGVTSGVAAMTSSQIGQSIQEGIRRNAAINPEAMQKIVSDGMSVLIAIETRIRAESSNINHSGIGIDSIHYEYMGYLRGGDGVGYHSMVNGRGDKDCDTDADADGGGDSGVDGGVDGDRGGCRTGEDICVSGCRRGRRRCI